MKQNKWQQITGEHITTVDALRLQITTKTIFCGELTTSTSTQLRDKLKRKAVVLSPAARLRRAGFLAELGQKQLEAGNYDNPATLHPIYLRRPNITQPKHR